jgi:hypothetical protein
MRGGRFDGWIVRCLVRHARSLGGSYARRERVRPKATRAATIHADAGLSTSAGVGNPACSAGPGAGCIRPSRPSRLR